MPTVRVIVFNADESFGPALRATLQSFEGVNIVAEVDEPALLPQTVTRYPADVLLVNLDDGSPSGGPASEAGRRGDPAGDAGPPALVGAATPMLPIAGGIAHAHPELSVFAISASNDGQLILSAMRLGLREFLTKPIDPTLLGAALDKVSRKRSESAPQGRLIAVMGSAGGVGATSLAVNLAVELASLASGRVAVVDLDYRFGQVATFLDLDPVYTIADLCESPEQLESQVIERTLVRHTSGVYVLGRPTHFNQADGITAAHCVGVVSTLASMHQYVIVDGPNRFDPGAKAVLDVADCTLLVMHLVVPSVRSALRMLEGMRQAGFNLERIKLVCNRVGRESGNLSVADVAATLARNVFATVPDEPAAMSSAVNFGEPLCTNHAKSKVRIAIRELAERLHRPPTASDDKAGGSRRSASLLSKIFAEA